MQVQPQVVMMQAQPVALDAKHLQSVDPFDPARHAIIYNARLSPSAKFLLCLPGGVGAGPAAPCSLATCGSLCNILQWDKLNARSYVRVYENGVAANYAMTVCFGGCIADNTSFVYFDKLAESVKQETFCTPLHFCYVMECAGGVLALAPMAGLNNCFCNCCRSFYGGIDNPHQFLSAITSAREVFKQGARLPAGAMLTAPLMVQMA